MELRKDLNTGFSELFRTPMTKIICYTISDIPFVCQELELLWKAIFLKEEMVTHLPLEMPSSFWVSNSNILNKLLKIPLWLPIILRVGFKWWASPYLWWHSHLQHLPPFHSPPSPLLSALLCRHSHLFQFTQRATFLLLEVWHVTLFSLHYFS